MSSLLAADEPPAFSAFNSDGRFPLLLACDHAGNAVPRALADLGLPRTQLSRHIGWDPGGLDVGRRLSELLDAPLVASTYSRLVIDCNRWPAGEGSTPQVSDGTPVPANCALDEAAIKARADACFWPYHNAIDNALDRFAARGVMPALFVVHSFTPVMGGIQRPWQLGVLWRTDPRLAKPLLAALREIADVFVGDNEPYSARDPAEYTLQAHAESRGLPHCSIEIRQDLIGDRAGAQRWAELIAPALRRAVQASLSGAAAI